MNSVYFCRAIDTWPDYWEEEPDTCVSLVVAATRGRAKVLAQGTTKGHTEYIDWRTQKVGETDEPEGVLSDHSPWWGEVR